MAEDYVHRIGRTARAGASGEAHSFACEDTAFYLPEIEEYIGMAVPMESVTSELLAEIKPRKRIQRNRVPHRPSGKGGKPSGGYKGKHKNQNKRNKSNTQSRKRKPAQNKT